MNGTRYAGVACGLLSVVLWAAAPASAQPADGTGTIVGSVVTSHGDAVGDALVSLVGSRQRVRAGEDGSFRFEGVRPGRYRLQAESLTFGDGSARVEVAAGAEARATVVLDVATLTDELMVTAGGAGLSQLEVAQATSVLAGEDLDFRRDGTLGGTLAQEPGVSSTYFGPGAGRPVIRGLGGDRIRTLTDGLGSADVSNVSPDHAVSLDPGAAERIEVLRGPATLLYGSTAVGGVVNVLDSRIPEYAPEEPVSGTVEANASTVADERVGAVSLTGGAGRFAWHADYSKRETDDYEIPGFAEAAHGEEEEGEHEEEEEVFGVLENSAVESDGGSLGFSIVGDAGMLGVAVSGFDTLYGVPGHAHEGEEGEGEEGEEGGVRIDLEQRRADLKGEVLRPFGAFRGAKVRLGVADYEHVELEGEEVGTRFLSDSWEGRFELIQQQRGRLSGSLGAQLSSSDFEAAGEEAFVPPSRTRAAALFAFEEVGLGDAVKLQLGGRFERHAIAVESADPDRDFDGVSGSLGLVWEPSAAYSLALSLARSERLPTSNELYANGPHAATRAFEIGDSDLDKETSLGVDLSLRKRTGRLTATLNLFANRFDAFIFERFTGEVEDGLDVILFDQQDAEFYGAELQALVNLFQLANDSHLDLQLSADSVRAELRDTGEPVPRIPPLRFGLGLHYHWQRLRAFAEAIRAEEQDRVSANETPTPGYTLVNAGVSYRLILGGQVLDVVLRGRNLGDEEARNHVSYLKDVAPLPGRDVGLSLRLAF